MTLSFEKTIYGYCLKNSHQHNLPATYKSLRTVKAAAEAVGAEAFTVSTWRPQRTSVTRFIWDHAMWQKMASAIRS